MIVVDVETSGLSPITNGLLSIGAVDFDTGAEFYGECRLGLHKTYDERALAVNGFTVDQIFDKNKASDEELYLHFLNWVLTNKFEPLLAGQQIGSFDMLFLQEVAGGKTEFERFFSKRSVDLHSVAYARYKESLSLDKILVKLCLQPEPKPHNGLNGARLERDCFKLLFA